MQSRLPKEFKEKMQELLKTEYNVFIEAMEDNPPTTVRVNIAKTDALSADNNSVPWHTDAFYLQQRIPFTFDPYFHAGRYYVQEASSMFVGHIIKEIVKEPVRLLDLCAAPGGKTTLAIDTLPKGSVVVSNEYVASRANILAENVAKWGSPNCIVTNNTPANYGEIKEHFNVIIVDAPCSGEGMFRKDPDSISHWTPQSPKTSADRQKTIIDDVWDALAEDGILIYSTCTYNTEENEDIAKYICNEFDAEPYPTIQTPPNWGITPQLKGDIPFYRFMPHKTMGEGFAVTIIRKTSGASRNKKGKASAQKSIKLPENISKLLKNHKEYNHTEIDNTIYSIPNALHPTLNLLKRFKLLHIGIPVAEIKGKDYKPHHALALSTQLNINEVDTEPLTLADARRYLRREAIAPSTPSQGYKLVTYNGVPLGWIKCIGVRANNLYPQEWRIRSSYNPKEGERATIFE